MCKYLFIRCINHGNYQSPGTRLDLEKILTRYGFQKRGAGTGSSHFTFRKKDHYPITIPKKNRIKKIYIIKVKEIVEKEETNFKIRMPKNLHRTLMEHAMYKIKKASE